MFTFRNADVPAEVANEVQKVLNTVANEKKSSSVAPFAGFLMFKSDKVVIF